MSPFVLSNRVVLVALALLHLRVDGLENPNAFCGLHRIYCDVQKVTATASMWRRELVEEL